MNKKKEMIEKSEAEKYKLLIQAQKNDEPKEKTKLSSCIKNSLYGSHNQ